LGYLAPIIIHRYYQPFPGFRFFLGFITPFYTFAGGINFAFAAAPVHAESDSDDLVDHAAEESQSVQPSKIRKEFPETWIWEGVDDMGLVQLFAN
jgi:hypothetical protein